ncbi:MAG: hypothetical protein FJY39_11785 [Betaproteobacteria bacterium]|nr:hypothetical protein [Betaproteobacteria bacterium]
MLPAEQHQPSDAGLGAADLGGPGLGAAGFGGAGLGGAGSDGAGLGGAGLGGVGLEVWVWKAGVSTKRIACRGCAQV